MSVPAGLRWHGGAEALDAAVAESLGATEMIGGKLDPSGIGSSLGRALVGAGLRPLTTGASLARFGARMAGAAGATAAHAVGLAVPGPLSPDPRDKRFRDPAWTDHPLFFSLLQTYLNGRKLLLELTEAAPLPEPAKSKARFGAGLVGDALAPTNFLATNPAAMRRAFETGGISVLRGLRNLVRDVRTNGGWPQQVDRSGFQLGVNLAATPGKVVYRNGLMEVLQYAPTTPQVRELPVLLCPPWINKYYIMDLAEGRSLARWCVDHGLTTFAISYRNPDASTPDLTPETYLHQGVQEAVDVVTAVCGTEVANLLGVCMGGTLNAALLAYEAAMGRSRVNSATFVNSLVDFTGAGTLGSVFGDPAALRVLERGADKGYVEAAKMAHTFNLLRANDLVFSYVVSNWLMGETPPAVDLLAWNADGTNMPVRMHVPFLRQCYVENALANDEMVIGGVRLLASKVSTDTYFVAAVDDHIVPWEAAYAATQVFQGPARFVLSSGGHIAGIVAPPTPRSRLWAADDVPPSVEAWRAGAVEQQASWWDDWAIWVASRSGELVDPPPMGGGVHPVLGDAPGIYVGS